MPTLSPLCLNPVSSSDSIERTFLCHLDLVSEHGAYLCCIPLAAQIVSVYTLYYQLAMDVPINMTYQHVRLGYLDLRDCIDTLSWRIGCIWWMQNQWPFHVSTVCSR